MNYDRLVEIFKISYWSAFFLLLLPIVFMLNNGISNYFLYQELGIQISVRNSVGLSVINTLGNLLPFSGGLIAKGLFLKQRYGLTYAKYLSATGALFVCFLSTNGLIGFVSLGFLSILRKVHIPGYLLIGFILLMSSMILFWFPFNHKLFPKRFRKKIKNIEGGWQILRDNPNLLLLLVIIQAISVIITGLRFFISFRTFSQPVSFVDCLVFSSATILTRLVSIVPAGIGVREGIVAGLGTVLGFDAGVSAVAVGFDRIIATLTVILLGFYFTYDLGMDLFQENVEY